jgi:hypothetical protein
MTFYEQAGAWLKERGFEDTSSLTWSPGTRERGIWISYRCDIGELGSLCVNQDSTGDKMSVSIYQGREQNVDIYETGELESLKEAVIATRTFCEKIESLRAPKTEKYELPYSTFTRQTGQR